MIRGVESTLPLLKIHDKDNVAVVIEAISKDEVLFLGQLSLIAQENMDKGHKIALTNIKIGENVIKYGFPIGHAIADIKAGEWIHVHNIKTNLGEILDYEYHPEVQSKPLAVTGKTFKGFRRPDGQVGVRNEIWIIPTVSCVNRNIQLMAKYAMEKFQKTPNIDGIYEFTHPYGCSQLGEDQLTTQRILADLVNHPNAGGILVVGLGCENNNIAEFVKVLGEYDTDRVKFLVAQEVEDEIEAGLKLIDELVGYASRNKRDDCPVSQLVVGLKCGGSDGFSGITGNPLVGAFSDQLIAHGGSTVLTEVPEMFGAETILMNRAINEEVFGKTVKLINDFKQYFANYDQPIYENPSPGNKKGGISTLEEKSLGCTQKGGISEVVDVLGYAHTVKNKGLNLLSAPGNDMVAATALAAAGCQIVLFTTGRGTPLGTAVPTIKVATNSDIFKKKANWLDFDAGKLLTGQLLEVVTEEFFDYVIRVASGELTKSEVMGFREIAIFKNGVTL